MARVSEKQQYAQLFAELVSAAQAELPHISMGQLTELCRLSKRHHRGTERECNENGDYTTAVETKIISLLSEWLGSVPGFGVKFSGDPRGCTVKLVMPSGKTNDWGGEGICVPQ